MLVSAQIGLLGFLLGFLGSVPVAGPVAVLVLERGLARRAGEGLRVAMGAAVAEGAYACLAFWGLGAFLKALPPLVPASRLVGAALLVAVGAYLVARRPGAAPAAAGSVPRRASAHGAWLLGFMVTALNPTLVVTWTATVAALHATGLVRAGAVPALVFAGGVAAGVTAWFAVFIEVLRRAHHGLAPRTLARLVAGTGWVLGIAGLVLAARVIAALASAPTP